MKVTFPRTSYLAQKDVSAYRYDLLERSTHVQQSVPINGPLATWYTSTSSVPPRDVERLRTVRMDNLRGIRETVANSAATVGGQFAQYIFH